MGGCAPLGFAVEVFQYLLVFIGVIDIAELPGFVDIYPCDIGIDEHFSWAGVA